MGNPNLRVQLKLEVIEPRDVPAPLAFATPGGPIQVLEENGTTTQIANPFLEYAGPINIAVGDLIGVGNAPDGQADFVLAPGAGGGSRVVIVDGATRAMAMDFFAFDPTFRGGASVAVGDVIVNQLGTQPGSSGQGQVSVYDSKLELIVGAGPGGGPHVKVFDAASLGSRMAAPAARVEFMAFDVAFSGGVSVAGGRDKLNSENGYVIVGAGPGGGPNVRTFQITPYLTGLFTSRQQDFFAFDASFRGGVSVAYGGLIERLSSEDLDKAIDTYANPKRFDILVGAGTGGGPNVRVFAVGEQLLAKGVNEHVYRTADFFAYEADYQGGVTVGFGTLPGQNSKSILTSPSGSGGSHIRSFSPLAAGRLIAPTTSRRDLVTWYVGHVDGVLEGASIAPGLSTFLQSASILSGATVSSSAP